MLDLLDAHAREGDVLRRRRTRARAAGAACARSRAAATASATTARRIRRPGSGRCRRARMRDEIDAHAGRAARTHRRDAALVPRGGRHGQSVRGRGAASAHGLARVAWSARGFDAFAADPQRVVARIERQLSPGAIVLLHEGAGHGRNVEDAGAAAAAAGRARLSHGVAWLNEARQSRVATIRQLLNGVLPYSGVNFARRPAASNFARIARHRDSARRRRSSSPACARARRARG